MSENDNQIEELVSKIQNLPYAEQVDMIVTLAIGLHGAVRVALPMSVMDAAAILQNIETEFKASSDCPCCRQSINNLVSVVVAGIEPCGPIKVDA